MIQNPLKSPQFIGLARLEGIIHGMSYKYQNIICILPSLFLSPVVFLIYSIHISNERDRNDVHCPKGISIEYPESVCEGWRPVSCAFDLEIGEEQVFSTYQVSVGDHNYQKTRAIVPRVDLYQVLRERV